MFRTSPARVLLAISMSAFGLSGLAIPDAAGIAAAQVPQPKPPPTATLPLQGCPIPLRVTLTFLSNQPPTATFRGSNTWKVDWQVAGQLPGGINAISSFKITVSDQLGSHSELVHGAARTANVTVGHTRNTPATSLTPFATVEGFADARNCDTTLTYTSSGTSTSPSVACSVSMSFTSSPRVTQVFGTNPSGPQLPEGFAVKTDWSVSGGLANCVTLKGFNLRIIVRFPDGSRRTFTETLGASARAATVKVTNAVPASNSPEIQEVRLNAFTEVKLFGTGRQ